MEGATDWQEAALSQHAKERPALRHGGLYARTDTDHFEGTEKGLVTFAILTTTANEVIQPIHDRMPVMLARPRKDWLPASPSVMTIFPPFPSELLTAYPRDADDESRHLQRPRSHRPA